MTTMEQIMKPTSTILAGAIALACAAGLPLAAHAATAEEAATLKTSLTPLGAEKAGNKDGSIPAWDGAYTKISGAYKPGDARADPFAAEKPVLSITGKNVDQYASK